MAYRRFFELGFHDPVPHFSTFGKNYQRRFEESTFFEDIFIEILNIAIGKKLISADHVFIDTTHVKASSNKHKFEKKMVEKETHAYMVSSGNMSMSMMSILAVTDVLTGKSSSISFHLFQEIQ